MNLSRYKTLLQFLQISSRSKECHCGIRLYSNGVLISSPSPHNLKPKPIKILKPIGSIKPVVSNKPKRKENQKDIKKVTYHNDIDSTNMHDFDDVDECEEEQDLRHVKRIPNIRINRRLRDDPKYKEELIYENDMSKVDWNRNLYAKASVNTEENIQQSNEEVHEVSQSTTQDENFNNNLVNKSKVTPRSKIIETPIGLVEYDLSSDEFNVNKYINEIINTKPLEPLEKCDEDLSDFGPSFKPTFNFAAYADKSELIQEYVNLGVKLYKVEKNIDHMRALLTVDLKKELPVYIQFLHDCGVPADCLGDVITENPMILKEDLDDMKTRIRYLRAHDFSVESIARIVTKNPTWLTWATKHIDERLGHFQNEFQLVGDEIRFLATKQPKLITYKFKHIHENTFAVREEMGFNKDETKVLLLDKPRLWMISRKKIVDTFDYLHNSMKLTHLTIASQSDVLTCRKSRLKNRHEFLVELKKDQYDPKKPGYIAPKSVIYGSDVEFCRDVAKTAVETYNLFLKTR